MKKEINPQETSRSEAFLLWMSSPMPMVTLTKTLNVGNVRKKSAKKGLNLMRCFVGVLVRLQVKLRSFICCPNRENYINMTILL